MFKMETRVIPAVPGDSVSGRVPFSAPKRTEEQRRVYTRPQSLPVSPASKSHGNHNKGLVWKMTDRVSIFKSFYALRIV